MEDGRKLQVEGQLHVIEAIDAGRSPSERFALPSVRVTIELVE
jgi:hypothetical protein